MKIRLIYLATAALLAAVSQTAPAQEAAQPSDLPTVQASTLLFLLLTWNKGYADTADPIDINAFNIDFGDDSNGNANGKSTDNADSTANAVNVLLRSN